IGRSPTRAETDGRTLFTLATVLFLVQFPHLLHLPFWVCFVGAALVALRLWLYRSPTQKALRFLLSPITVTLLGVATALLLRVDYGYSLGRDPCVALLFVLVAAKFAEIRRASDATLLLCLSAFLLMTQYFYSQTILAALVTLPAVVALAFALSIVRDSQNPASNRAQLKLVGKLLVQGLPLAAVLFFVFPRLPGPLWSLPEDAMGKTGLSDSMSPGSIGSLSTSDDVAFRVEFDEAPPLTQQLYWRGPVLSDFDGRNWTISDDNYEVEPKAAADGNALHHYTVMLQPHRQRWLFALDRAVALPQTDTSHNTAQAGAPTSRSVGMMMADGQLIASQTVAQVVRYRQASALSDSLTPPRAPPKSTLYLPGKNPKAIAFAKSLRSESVSDLAYAHRTLQHFNRDTFRYTLQPQLLGDAPVDEFLFDSKAGFCEHYAAAFVVLMRAAGIPARVVTGYQGGEMNGDYMIVRQANAHAWAEAFIDGVWKRFDPTGFVAPARVEQGLSAALPNESTVTGLARLDASWLRRARLRWDALNHQWQRLVVNYDNSSQQKLWDRFGFVKPSLLQIVVAVIVLSVIWSAFILGMPGLANRHLPASERLWRRLSQLLANNHLPRARNESASEYLRRAGTRWPAQRIRLRQLDTYFSALRFQRTGDARAEALRDQIKRELIPLTVAITLARFQRQPKSIASPSAAPSS
ncbi:MAG: DUF3488 and transglutaminase-like domain-containing protein, partial [Pseudomonadota bacterium]